jgi:hypothetical protein
MTYASGIRQGCPERLDEAEEGVVEASGVNAQDVDAAEYIKTLCDALFADVEVIRDGPEAEEIDQYSDGEAIDGLAILLSSEE